MKIDYVKTVYETYWLANSVKILEPQINEECVP